MLNLFQYLRCSKLGVFKLWIPDRVRNDKKKNIKNLAIKNLLKI